MKFLTILALAAFAFAAVNAQCVDTKACSDPWEVIHAGDDKLAGEYLRNVIDQANAMTQDELDASCFEIVLVCGKTPGCVFDITGTAITFKFHFKIRGELKKGLRPVIFNQGTPLIIEHAGAASMGVIDETMVDVRCVNKWMHFEKVNLIADPNQPGDSAIFVKTGDLYLDQMLIKGHNSGITGSGGALRVDAAYAHHIRVETVKFLANGAEKGGAIAVIAPPMNAPGAANLLVINSHFEDNVATEKGGAAFIATALLTEFRGTTFTGNRATGSSMNIGEGGAIWTGVGKLLIAEVRSLGGNYAKFGQFLFAEGKGAEVTINGFVGKDDLEAFYLTDEASIPNINRMKLRRGIVCSDDGTDKIIIRGLVDATPSLFDATIFPGDQEVCGTDVQLGAYCMKGTGDSGVSEDDEDSDGVSCVYDCDDLDPNVRPGVGEVANGTDSNCNGLVDEWIDTDGDLTPDGYDACPEDFNKIAPGVCGCGLIDQADYNGCVTCVADDYGYGSSSSKEAPAVDPVYADGYWYILDTADWWWWDGATWAYGGAY